MVDDWLGVRTPNTRIPPGCLLLHLRDAGQSPLRPVLTSRLYADSPRTAPSNSPPTRDRKSRQSRSCSAEGFVPLSPAEDRTHDSPLAAQALRLRESGRPAAQAARAISAAAGTDG